MEQFARANTPLKNDIRERSASYPSLTVKEACDFTLKVFNKFSTVEATRKEIASSLEVTDLYISRDLAAAASFGLLDKTISKGEKEFKYKTSTIFLDIFRQENEQQKQVALLTAFGKPKLFSDLIAKFDSSIIPEELPNTLIKHHGITEAASKEAARIFIESGLEAGAINGNRLMNYRVKLSMLNKTGSAENKDSRELDKKEGEGSVLLQNPKLEAETDEAIKIPIHLTKNKIAYMIYPPDITDKDIKLFEHAINGIFLRLQLENETRIDSE